MKLSTQEEYGLRCLLQIGRHEDLTGGSLTIPEISRIEGLSAPNVAKLLRILRIEGYVESERGQTGGYRLSRPADQILISDVLATLGGPLFGPEFCEDHAGQAELCTHSIDCSIRSLWHTVQSIVDQVLNKITLKDLLCGERELNSSLQIMTDDLLQVS